MDIFILLTCLLSFYLHEYIFPASVQIPPLLATLLGTAIAFFVGFNNNQAYDRWWEARIIWGELVNDSRSLARNILNYTVEGDLEYDELSEIKKRIVFRHIGFVYALKETLRKKPDGYYEKYLNAEDLQKVKRESNISNAILTLHARDVQKLLIEKSLDEFRFMQINDLITSFTNQMGKSERIRNTVFPTSYVYFTQLFIWVLVIFTTLILSDLIGAWSISIGWIIGFVFHVSHQNGMSLMEPFDEISTGIPLNQISRTIEINLLQMLGEKDVPPPIEPINKEYIL